MAKIPLLAWHITFGVVIGAALLFFLWVFFIKDEENDYGRAQVIPPTTTPIAA